MVRGYLSIITAMLIWGSVGIFVRKAGQDPLLTVTLRVIFGGAALGLVGLAQSLGARGAQARDSAAASPKPAAASPWRRRALLAFSGIALATNWLFFFKAMATTTVSNTVLSYYTAPVLVALASPFLLRERLEQRTILATLVAFAGICIMLYQPGEALAARDLMGIGFGLCAALFYAMVTITGRWLSDEQPARLVLIQCAVAGLVLVPAVFATAGPGAFAVPAGALGLLAVVGAVHTALALFLYFVGLRTVKVQHVGVLGYLDPVSAVLFAYLFLGEAPTKASLLGGLLVLASSGMLLLRRKPAGTAEAA